MMINFNLLMPLLGTLVVFLGTIGIIKAFTDYKLKRRMIDLGHVDEKSMSIFKDQSNENFYASLKWGLVVFFAGLGLIVIQFTPYNQFSPIVYGIELAFVALGFLIYFFIARKDMEKKNLG